MSLDEKIQKFVQDMTEKKCEPSLAVMKEYFKPADMSCLWSRLKTERGRSPLSVRDAWESLCEKAAAGEKNKAKASCLFNFLIDGDMWKDRLLKETKKLSSKDEVQQANTEYSYGELVLMQGAEEADDWIAKGKYSSREDEWGDIIYTKTRRTELHSKSITNTAELERSVPIKRRTHTHNLTF